jgi:excisionase family DNA binding protein
MKTSITAQQAEKVENVDRLLSIEAAAELLGNISPWTVRKWIAERKIKSCKLGSRRLIPCSEIKRLIEASIATN